MRTRHSQPQKPARELWLPHTHTHTHNENALTAKSYCAARRNATAKVFFESFKFHETNKAFTAHQCGKPRVPVQMFRNVSVSRQRASTCTVVLVVMRWWRRRRNHIQRCVTPFPTTNKVLRSLGMVFHMLSIEISRVSARRRESSMIEKRMHVCVRARVCTLG